MANWEDKFILRYVEDNIILSPSDYFKYKYYMHDLIKKHLKNDIHTAIFLI